MYGQSELLSFLIEADTSTEKEDTSDPVDTDIDKENKDISGDKSDVESDSTDADGGTVNSDTDSNEDDSSSSDTTGSDGDDNSTLAGSDSSSPDDPVDVLTKQKKLVLYKALREAKTSYQVLSETFDKILNMSIPKENQNIFKLIKDKVDFNLEKLDELLSDTNIINSKSVADLQVLFNIYSSDLSLINDNIKVFIKTDKKLDNTLKESFDGVF